MAERLIHHTMASARLVTAILLYSRLLAAQGRLTKAAGAWERAHEEWVAARRRFTELRPVGDPAALDAAVAAQRSRTKARDTARQAWWEAKRRVDQLIGTELEPIAEESEPSTV